MNTMNNMPGVNQPHVYPMNMASQKSSSGCWTDVLKVGCGFLAGVAVSILAMVIWGISVSNNSIPISGVEEQESIFDDVTDEGDVRYFDVKSKKGEARIHTGMPKDSVIMLLGKPTQFMSTEYSDEITYESGPYDTNILTISFEDGKVSSVIQF
ncbi:MAG: hypothetical protein IJG81_10120 [Muribaculaceae bacterium]|nr:hypothetical protein [Muribaculaceae bacterium]MBR0024014.1 hypothetical protein [Muribaculaceae bacterium]